MTDTVEKAARDLWSVVNMTLAYWWDCEDESIRPDDDEKEHWRAVALHALSTLTPGARWTLPDGREMVAVPVEPTREALLAGEHVLADHAIAMIKRRPDGSFDPNYPEQYARDAWSAMIAAASEPG